MNIRNSVSLVTGGASGLGEATVRWLCSLGAKVCIIDISQEQGENLAREMGKQVIFCRADICNESDVNSAIEETMSSLGYIGILVNCAGTGAPKKVLDKEGLHSLALFNKVIQVNLIGTFNVIRLVAAKMVENIPNNEGERGVIINTASIAAFDGQIGQASYSASKGGIVGMTLPLAREFSRFGIRVVTIAPGLFKTPLLMTLPENVLDALGKMVPFPARLGKPHEFALLVESTISNTMLNGTTIRLDGAIRMQPK